MGSEGSAMQWKEAQILINKFIEDNPNGEQVLADRLLVSRGTIQGWKVGLSRPHPVAIPLLVKALKEIVDWATQRASTLYLVGVFRLTDKIRQFGKSYRLLHILPNAWTNK